MVTPSKDFTNPEYIGPGVWYTIHMLSFKAQTLKRQFEVAEIIKQLCNSFPCEICKEHCKDYIINNPIENYLTFLVKVDNKFLPLGLFLWTWEFHNSVNKRLNKPLMDWNTAYNLYSNTESLICNNQCLEKK